VTRTVPSPPERPCARYVIPRTVSTTTDARLHAFTFLECLAKTSLEHRPPSAGHASIREIPRLGRVRNFRDAVSSGPDADLSLPQVDRFIPSRSALDLDIAHYNLVKENASSADLDLASEVASPSKVRTPRSKTRDRKSPSAPRQMRVSMASIANGRVFFSASATRRRRRRASERLLI